MGEGTKLMVFSAILEIRERGVRTRGREDFGFNPECMGKGGGIGKLSLGLLME